MFKLAILAGGSINTYMYFARVITFDFATNRRGLSIFSKNQICNVAI